MHQPGVVHEMLDKGLRTGLQGVVLADGHGRRGEIPIPDGDRAVRADHAKDLGQECLWPRDMRQHGMQHAHIKRGGGKRQRFAIGVQYMTG